MTEGTIAGVGTILGVGGATGAAPGVVGTQPGRVVPPVGGFTGPGPTGAEVGAG